MTTPPRTGGITGAHLGSFTVEKSYVIHHAGCENLSA